MDAVELEKRIGMNIPRTEFEEIRYDASYQPQDSMLLKKNKAYVVLGHEIISGAYALYLYSKKRDWTQDGLTRKMQGAYFYFENEIFTKYELEDFVIKCNGELEQRHPDIASRLIVLMYQHYGFLSVYKFLGNFFINDRTEVLKEPDYKTIIQEYAQLKKIPYSYEILDTAGPDHQREYTYRLTLGNLSSIAKAESKKKAKWEAAKYLVNTHKYIAINTKAKKKQSDSAKTKRVLSEKRKRDLFTAWKLLDLPPNSFSYQQLDEIFMHRSYQNDNPNQKCHSNACIAIVGAKLIGMLCIEFVLNNYDILHIDVVKEKGRILQEDNLSQSIPEAALGFILKSKQEITKRMGNRFKIDVLRGIIGMMWLNYIVREDDKIKSFATKYADKILRISSKSAWRDYKTVLQEVCQNFEWTSSSTCRLERTNKDNSNVFFAKSTVEGKGWVEHGFGMGDSKGASTNAASKDVLLKLAPHCKEDKSVEAQIIRMLNPELFCEYFGKKEYRDAIDKTEAETTSERKTSVPESEVSIQRKKLVLGNIKDIPKNVRFNSTSHVLYICKGTVLCHKNKHEIVSSTGILTALNGRDVQINVNYCCSCKLFFINLTEFKYYQERYGALLGNISIQQTLGRGGVGRYENYADESTMRICGYTVNQTVNLSSEQRRKILEMLMEYDIVKKHRIMEYLQFFINTSQYRHNMKSAIEKWTEDLEWVRDYNINKQRKQKVTNIKKW